MSTRAPHISPRRVALATAALVAVSASLIGFSPNPADAVPASVPSVNFSAGRPNTVTAWNYGTAAPSSRELKISSATREIRMTLPFKPVQTLGCQLRNSDGEVLVGTFVTTTPDQPGPLVGVLDVEPGLVESAGPSLQAECSDGDTRDSWIARFKLSPVAQAPTILSIVASDSLLTSRTAFRYSGADAPRDSGATGRRSGVIPGSRVRVYGAPGDFATEGLVNKYQVTLRASNGKVLSGLDVSTAREGSIIGFTVPAGLPAGEVLMYLKVVASQPATPTAAKYDIVSRWSDIAIYEPNLDGKSFTLSPSPIISGTPVVGSTVTTTPGAWLPTATTYTYRWLRDNQPIAGATSPSYLIGAADHGRDVNVEVTAVKSGLRTTIRVSNPLEIP